MKKIIAIAMALGLTVTGVAVGVSLNKDSKKSTEVEENSQIVSEAVSKENSSREKYEDDRLIVTVPDNCDITSVVTTDSSPTYYFGVIVEPNNKYINTLRNNSGWMSEMSDEQVIDAISGRDITIIEFYVIKDFKEYGQAMESKYGQMCGAKDWATASYNYGDGSSSGLILNETKFQGVDAWEINDPNNELDKNIYVESPKGCMRITASNFYEAYTDEISEILNSIVIK